MTECERIINEGLLPESFFDEEVRCDFLVSKERKKIWAIGIDILLKLDEVCKKYNLRYWLAYGTLLGAVRHNGFVPWDDDIDVCMLREDYEKLLTLQDEFTSPYFLQTPYTDKGYYYSYCKIRNSNTTAFSKNFRYHFSSNNCNSGMSLDIFCLDKWNNDEEAEILYYKIKNLIVNNSTYMKLSNPDFKNDERVVNYNGANPLDTYEEIQQLSQSYLNKNMRFVSIPTNTTYGFRRDLHSLEAFSDTVFHDFEGFQLPIPIGYDIILKTTYGDYKEFPPLNARGTWHSAIIDAERPYSDYYKKFFAGKKLWQNEK